MYNEKQPVTFQNPIRTHSQFLFDSTNILQYLEIIYSVRRNKYLRNKRFSELQGKELTAIVMYILPHIRFVLH